MDEDIGPVMGLEFFTILSELSSLFRWRLLNATIHKIHGMFHDSLLNRNDLGTPNPHSGSSKFNPSSGNKTERLTSVHQFFQ